MNRKATSPSLKVLLYPLIFGVAVILMIAVFGGMIMEKYEDYEKRLVVEEEKRSKLESVQAELQDYKQRQQRFERDREFLARVAHEQGMVFPNEFRIDFKDEADR